MTFRHHIMVKEVQKFTSHMDCWRQATCRVADRCEMMFLIHVVEVSRSLPCIQQSSMQSFLSSHVCSLVLC